MAQPQNKILGVFSLVMITVSAIVSLRNLPLLSSYGLSALFSYFVAAFGFLIPAALIAAELATGWQEDGGIFAWVRAAFGESWGFVAIWFATLINVAWLPTVLSFPAATLAFAFDPQLASNGAYILFFTLGVLWFATLVNYYGMASSALVSSVGTFLGTVLPGFLIILFGVWWVFNGNPIQFDTSITTVLPPMGLEHIVFLGGVTLAFGGVEITAYHIQETKNPQKDYFKAIAIASVIVVTLSVVGTLSIAAVVPKQELSLVAGLMQAFAYFFDAFHLSVLLPPLAILAAIGTLSQVNTWLIGPINGLFYSGKSGFLPESLMQVNRYGAPVAVLLVQSVVASVLAAIFIVMPSVSSSYWLLTALASQLQAIVYGLMFLSAIWLRYKHPERPRAFRVPGGNWGILLLGGVGLVCCTSVLILGFIPPAALDVGDIIHYELFLCGGMVLLLTPGLWFIRRRQRLLK